MFKEVYCEKCNKTIPNIGHSYIKENGSVKECNVCKWKKLHSDKLKLANGRYTDYELDRFLFFWIYKESEYINDIAEILNKSIDDMIDLFKLLNICNRKCLIRINCECCLKLFDCNIAHYITPKYRYCSTECYRKDKSNKVMHGKDSIFYNRIETSCDYCGKILFVTPNKYKELNRYGESHNFCSHTCYSLFRSNYYIGEKSVNYGKSVSSKTLDKMRFATANRIKNISTTQTSIHKSIDILLDNIGINHISEYNVKFYSIDEYLSDYNLAIEIMGDYWHANPIIYNKNNKYINSIQVKDIIKDKKKRTYLIKYNNIHVLYLWETDIKNDINKCRLLINEFINNNGVLQNYNSFNWTANGSRLFINKEIIYPYFELDKSFYQEIEKQNA